MSEVTSNSQQPYEAMRNLLDLLKEHKPNDRSEADRHYAITITDCQRMIAFFKVYVVDGATDAVG